MIWSLETKEIIHGFTDEIANQAPLLDVEGTMDVTHSFANQEYFNTSKKLKPVVLQQMLHSKARKPKP